jgi:hypothetical protein
MVFVFRKLAPGHFFAEAGSNMADRCSFAEDHAASFMLQKSIFYKNAFIFR